MELLAEVSKLRRPLKTIVLTAYNDLQNVRAAMMRGAFDFQVKPLDVVDLRTTILKAVTIVRQLQAGEEARQHAVELTEQKQRVEDIFGRYVGPVVKAQLLARPEGHLGSERRTLTVLMADIRGFNRFVRSSSTRAGCAGAERIPRAARPKSCSVGMERSTKFSATVCWSSSAHRSATTTRLRTRWPAALELQLAMNDLNASHRGQGLPELALGIGVHSGEAVVGTIGSKRRQKYTAIGKTVNLVARIESHSVGGQVLVSGWAYDEIKDIADILGSFQLRAKGFTDPITVHDVRGLAGEYDLRLPSAERTLHVLPVPRPVGLAIVKDKMIGEQHPAEVIASGEEALRVRTEVVVSPFDDLMLDVAGSQAFVKVIECDSQQGVCDPACRLHVGSRRRPPRAGRRARHGGSPARIVRQGQAGRFSTSATGLVWMRLPQQFGQPGWILVVHHLGAVPDEWCAVGIEPGQCRVAGVGLGLGGADVFSGFDAVVHAGVGTDGFCQLR